MTYQAYFHIPDEFSVKDRKTARYYFGAFSGGRSRKGTFIYTQSMRQLERFLRGTKQDHYLHANSETFEVVNRQKYDGPAIYIVTHIREQGVRIEFSHPFTGHARMRESRLRHVRTGLSRFKESLPKSVHT